MAILTSFAILPMMITKIVWIEKKTAKSFGGFGKNRTFATAFREMHLTRGFSGGNSSVGRAQPCQGWGREFESRLPLHILNNTKDRRSLSSQAQVAELVDAHVSGACAARRAGSSPVLGTSVIQNVFCWRGGGIGRRATLRG